MKLMEGLYYRIGLKVQQQRKDHRITQEDLEDAISRPTLSNIEHGKTSYRNTCFLNERQVSFFSTDFRTALGLGPISSSEFIWGDDEAREELIKTWTLAVLINGPHNPFSPGDQAQWQQQPGVVTLVDALTASQDISYFCDAPKHEMFERMVDKPEPKLAIISNLLWRGITNDSIIERWYVQDLYNSYLSFCPDPASSFTMAKQLISDVLFDDDAMQMAYISKDPMLQTRLFLAYNKLWALLRDGYMRYFTENLFDVFDDSEFDARGMRKLKTKVIIELFASPELQKLTEEVLLVNEFIDHGTMISSLDKRLTLINSVLRAELDLLSEQRQNQQQPMSQEERTLVDLYHTLDYCKAKINAISASPLPDSPTIEPANTDQDDPDNIGSND